MRSAAIGFLLELNRAVSNGISAEGIIGLG